MMNARRWCKRWAVLSVVLAGALPVAPRAATWHVTYDPAQPEDRVGSVAAQAVSGDTILIDPGTYYEHIPLEGKSLTFIGTAGAAATILDGSRELAGRGGSIIYTMTRSAADLVVRGLTLRNGTGAGPIPDVIAGGAILWVRDRGLPGTLTLSDCALENNTTGPHGWGYAAGGAISAGGLVDVRIERCSFSGNVSHGFGGDVMLGEGQAVITQCSFFVDDTNMSSTGRIYHEGFGSLTISQSVFEADVHYPGPSEGIFEILSMVLRTELVDNRFIDHGALFATRVALYNLPVEGIARDVVVTGNVFWNESGPDSAGPVALEISMDAGTLAISENTFVRCGLRVMDFDPVVFERNIVARGTAVFWASTGRSVSCNDFWRTPVTDHYGTLVFTDNISEPPLFCDEPAGDLEIARASPCAAENSPAGCGRIGALDPACDVSPVKQMSWGRLKALFR